jgi:hypothetical protein
MATLNISPEDVFYIIVKAREYDGQVSPTGLEQGSNAADDGGVAILEDTPDNPTGQELRAALQSRNIDEKADLLALMWLGRGSADSFTEARREAASTDPAHFTKYLMETPLLGDYLEEGLSQLGYSLAEFEAGRL